MKFRKYNDIENTYRQKEIDLILEHGYGDKEFVVSEKCDGSNFSIYCSGDTIMYGKRSGFIGNGENFYNYQRLETEQKLDKKIVAASEGHEEVVFYGELCGGSYPHNDVENLNVKSVQKRVYYHPDIVFVCFDIRVNGEYVNDDIRVAMCREHGIPFLPVLFRGSLAECLEYPNEFNSGVPSLFGLPEIEGNTVEGVVIKPTNPLYFRNGSRIILKNKNDKFKERGGKNKAPKEELPSELVEILNVYCEYINENRLRAVISKIGEIGQGDFGKLMKAMNEDVVKDYLKDHSDVFNSLEKEQRKRVTKAGNQTAAKLIRQNFLAVIDGNF